MISPFQPTKILILLVVSCLAWIGIISLGLVFFLGAAALVGWIIAGALLSATAVGFWFIAREIRNAVEMPEGCEPGFGLAKPHASATCGCRVRPARLASRSRAGRRNPRPGSTTSR